MGSPGQSGQAIKLFQAPRKISFTFYFWHKSFILDDMKLTRVIQQQFWMKECDILGVKTYSDPYYIFSGVKTPNPQDLYPCLQQFQQLRSTD